MVNSVRAVIDRKQRFVAALFAFVKTFGQKVQKWNGGHNEKEGISEKGNSTVI